MVGQYEDPVALGSRDTADAAEDNRRDYDYNERYEGKFHDEADYVFGQNPMLAYASMLQ